MRIWIFIATVLVVAITNAADPEPGPNKRSDDTQSPQAVELRGRVVCLPEEMHRIHKAELSTKHEHIYAFRTEAGVYYTLLRGKMSEALFIDPALREKELLIKGRVFPQSQVLEVMGNLRSVREGKVYEVYYYCSICSIKGILPGECMCCQEPVELLERVGE